MEQFRLRVRHEPKRGNLWEMHLVPESPAARRAAPSRLLGSASAPEAVRWLADLLLALAPSERSRRLVDSGAKAPPVALEQEAGMRLALAFGAARYLVGPRQRADFARGLLELPSEVLLYWFTTCFYGHRPAAGRAALRTLLTYEEALEANVARSSPRRGRAGRKDAQPAQRDLFSLATES
jgi:hypothetical protein